MASITTISPFVNAAAMVAGTWNTKYDLLYNTLNGTLDNANFATTAGVNESKLTFKDTGHDHSGNKALGLSSITTVGANKGDIIFFNNAIWATVGSGAAATKLKCDFDSYTKLVSHFDGTDNTTSFTDVTSGAKSITNNAVVDSYTKLLLHYENNLNDSAQGLAVTNSNVSFSNSIYKLGAYAGVYTNSAYCTLVDTADWQFGSSDFTIDAYIYLRVADGGSYTICSQASDANNYVRLQVDSNNLFFNHYDGATNFTLRSSNTLNATTWYHVAVVRSGNNWNLYIDGVSYASATNTLSITDFSGTFDIGVLDNGGLKQYFNGYIDDFRVSTGIARYTSTFTPHKYSYNLVSISTSTTVYGSGSAIFNGDAYLSLADHADWNFGTGDLTIDSWLNFISLPTSGALQYIYSQRSSATNIYYLRLFNNGGTYQWMFDWLNTTYQLQVDVNSTGLSTGTWYHLATVRSSNTWRIYQNGVQCGTDVTQSVTMPDLTGAFCIGATTSSTTDLFNGYMDEVRISKGIPRWPAPFATSTTAYSVALMWE